MVKFQSSKVFDGFSTVFRQWKANTTHCQYVHGYGISFKVYFEGGLDERNWVGILEV
jgi:6-pyruvoyltetrahydropterin/6-carboxytetrahydropterin synthase